MASRSGAGTARERVLTAALGLFAKHGVNGTSLQMIADEIGVTKAAVYYQFQSKDEIVQAVITPYLQRLALLVETAERKRRRTERAETVLAGIVDLAIENRSLATSLISDPAMLHVLRDRRDMQDLERRVTVLLTGPDPDTQALVSATMISGGVMVTMTDPRVAHLDDETLRHHMLISARRLLRLRVSPTAP